MDRVSSERRSEIMSRVRSKDTKPEMIVRRLVHGLGYRYRLHSKDVPGKPDLVFRSRKKAIFVHGCFWHRHEGCPRSSMPKTRVEFWQSKFRDNIKRDQKVYRELHSLGWDYLVLWECEVKDILGLKEKILAFMGN